MTNPQIIVTGDGSHTLFVPELNEHYHSTFGAIAESRHIFIDDGFRAASDNFQQINVFEVGFGTGLNALLTQIEAEKSEIPVTYTSVETFPLRRDTWSLLNYSEKLKIPGCFEVFSRLHDGPWNDPIIISKNFTLKKVLGSIEEFIPVTSVYNLVYFDAFAPDKQPGVWTESIFRKIYKCMVPGGILVTYSVKGEVVRRLKSIGFDIEKLSGPHGKRHILRATKP